MTRFLITAAILILVTACKPENETRHSLKTGIWRATIEIQGQLLPFNFELTNDKEGGYDVYLRNANEKLLLDEISVSHDSVDMALHIFDANIKAAIDGDTLKGEFIKNYEKNYRIPFVAVYGQAYRFEKSKNQTSVPDFRGMYEVTFLGDTTQAVGIFNQQSDSITGTFLTPTGDYRFLQGNVADGKMQLSTFDGNHAYLFTATKENDSSLVGEYYSGKTWKEKWIAKKNDFASLPDPESLTYLKKGYEKIEFSFPNIDRKPVTLNDEKYKNKVVVLQIFGTWCPNCMDETKFLAPWYSENKDRGIEIIGLAYERKDDFDYASGRVKKMIDKFNVSYDFVVAGTNDKAKASETLPQLNKIAAFPTTIFIGKDGKVKKIHTGFSGPGTGKYYDQFVQHFNETINELLTEDLTSKK
jgi:thiol-disulfide isomerase/thioredoxin